MTREAQLAYLEYIVSMLDPLVAMAKLNNLYIVAHLLEMALLEATNQLTRLKAQ